MAGGKAQVEEVPLPEPGVPQAAGGGLRSRQLQEPLRQIEAQHRSRRPHRLGGGDGGGAATTAHIEHAGPRAKAQALDGRAAKAFEDAKQAVAARYPEDTEATILYALVLSANFDPADKKYTNQDRRPSTPLPAGWGRP